MLSFAREDPVAFVTAAPNSMLIVDEAQRARELILPLKASVDAERRPGRFLLTGSADLLQAKGAADSLAGRAQTIEMLPLSQGELARRSTPEGFVSLFIAGVHQTTGLDGHTFRLVPLPRSRWTRGRPRR